MTTAQAAPNDPVHFLLYEARRFDLATERDPDGNYLPTKPPRAYLHGLTMEAFRQDPTLPSFLTTAPRDLRNGLPLDWWIEPARMLVASSLPITGTVTVLVNGHNVLMHELHTPTMLSAAAARTPPGRFRGPVSDKKRQRRGDGCSIEIVADLVCHGIAEYPGQSGVPSPRDACDVGTIRTMAEGVLERFDAAHPDARDLNPEAPGCRYILHRHRHDIEALTRLPTAPWIVVALEGAMQVVIV